MLIFTFTYFWLTCESACAFLLQFYVQCHVKCKCKECEVPGEFFHFSCETACEMQVKECEEASEFLLRFMWKLMWNVCERVDIVSHTCEMCMWKVVKSMWNVCEKNPYFTHFSHVYSQGMFSVIVHASYCVSMILFNW